MKLSKINKKNHSKTMGKAGKQVEQTDEWRYYDLPERLSYSLVKVCFDCILIIRFY